jgi:class 3 adenylate cyclase
MESEYYLFASQSAEPEQTPRTVFCHLKGDSIARALCDLFINQFSQSGETFTFEQRKAFSVSYQVLLDEAIEALELYDDPDPGIYDPPPPIYIITLAQYALRARTWERLLRERLTDVDLDTNADADGETQATTEDELPTMPAEDRRNSGLIVLMLVAQAYYKLLESSISMASWCSALDVELNDSYFWTTKMITNLLKNHEDLKDFPVVFEPIVPDLYPSTIRDMDWEDGMAPEADSFLSTVHQYVHSKGIYDPEEGSHAWIFVELYRPGVNRAIERANAYHNRMKEYCQRMFGTQEKDPALTETAKTVTKTIVELDLVGYSSIARNVEESLDVRTVAQVNQQIHGFIDLGLNAANSSQDDAVMTLTGDGAILAFDSAEQAHTFAEAINRATQEHNKKRKDRFAMRVFRIGAATGEIVMKAKPGGGFDIAGSTIARAVRLEAKATPGGFWWTRRRLKVYWLRRNCSMGLSRSLLVNGMRNLKLTRVNLTLMGPRMQ